MNSKFTFKPVDVIWLDSLPEIPGKVIPTGRMRLFTEVLKQRPGTWGKYPHAYAARAGSALWSVRKAYPEIQWEARGDSLFGRFPG